MTGDTALLLGSTYWPPSGACWAADLLFVASDPTLLLGSEAMYWDEKRKRWQSTGLPTDARGMFLIHSRNYKTSNLGFLDWKLDLPVTAFVTNYAGRSPTIGLGNIADLLRPYGALTLPGERKIADTEAYARWEFFRKHRQKGTLRHV